MGEGANLSTRYIFYISEKPQIRHCMDQDLVGLISNEYIAETRPYPFNIARPPVGGGESALGRAGGDQ